MAEIQEKVITARLPATVFDEIVAVAKERNRKKSAIVREAIETYLATWADYQIAIERLKDASDRVLSEKEFLDELGWDI